MEPFYMAVQEKVRRKSQAMFCHEDTGKGDFICHLHFTEPSPEFRVVSKWLKVFQFFKILYPCISDGFGDEPG